MNNTLTDRQSGLLRATVPAMIRPSTTLLERKGDGYPKRFHRQLKAEYLATHNILGEIELLARHTPGCAQQRFTPELLIQAVQNYERAQQRLNQARRLPQTFLCARVRVLALDNESVALEVLEAVASIATAPHSKVNRCYPARPFGGVFRCPVRTCPAHSPHTFTPRPEARTRV